MELGCRVLSGFSLPGYPDKAFVGKSVAHRFESQDSDYGSLGPVERI